MPDQNSAAMRVEILRWLHAHVVAQSVDALLRHVDGCVRFLRDQGIDEIHVGGPFMTTGVARIDNLIDQWFLEHRTAELRRRDAETEHNIRDLTRIRPVKGSVTRKRRKRK